MNLYVGPMNNSLFFKDKLIFQIIPFWNLSINNLVKINKLTIKSIKMIYFSHNLFFAYIKLNYGHAKRPLKLRSRDLYVFCISWCANFELWALKWPKVCLLCFYYKDKQIWILKSYELLNTWHDLRLVVV